MFLSIPILVSVGPNGKLILHSTGNKKADWGVKRKRWLACLSLFPSSTLWCQGAPGNWASTPTLQQQRSKKQPSTPFFPNVIRELSHFPSCIPHLSLNSEAMRYPTFTGKMLARAELPTQPSIETVLVWISAPLLQVVGLAGVRLEAELTQLPSTVTIT